ncbi:MAG: phosphohydrolase, partial [Lachnospiraceae bacterium]|nr:phosphohydrolase [Lachnospiraceae bacterium]
MKFVPTENLKPGMRLARPIFNKKGVMLYERDTKLTPQGISSVRNFELIGIYVLEPAEPLPPMTEDDREFERFQTMSVFVLQEIIENILNGEAPQK